jgi:hypothetical protein
MKKENLLVLEELPHEVLLAEEKLSVKDLPANIAAKVKGIRAIMRMNYKKNPERYNDSVIKNSYETADLIQTWIERDLPEPEPDPIKTVEPAKIEPPVEPDPKKKSGWGWIVGGLAFIALTVAGVSYYNNNKK